MEVQLLAHYHLLSITTHVESSGSTKDSKAPESKGLSVRHKLDKGCRTEQILKNPLALHSSRKHETSEADHHDTESHSSHNKDFKKIDDDEKRENLRASSCTRETTSGCPDSINKSGKAVSSTFTIFSDAASIPESKSHEYTAVKTDSNDGNKGSIGGSGFTIFSDEATAETSLKATDKATKIGSSRRNMGSVDSGSNGGGGFTIFSDTAPTENSVSLKGTDRAAKKSSDASALSKNKDSSSSGGFTIFSDTAPTENSVGLKGTDRAAKKSSDASALSKNKDSSSSGGFTIFSDTAPTENSVSLKGTDRAAKKSSDASALSKNKDSSSSGGFTIFSDTAPTENSVSLKGTDRAAKKSSDASALSKNKDSSSSGGFTIFSDTALTENSVSLKGTDRTAKKSSDASALSKNKDSSSSGGFTIFSDTAPTENSVSLKGTDRAAKKSSDASALSKNKDSSSSGGFTIFSDVTNSLEKASNQGINANEYSTVKGGGMIDSSVEMLDAEESDIDFNFLDRPSENETINTKLAKMDIDQMFYCNPTPEKSKIVERSNSSKGRDGLSSVVFNPNDEFEEGCQQHSIRSNNSMVYMDDSQLHFESTTDVPLPTVPEEEVEKVDIFKYSSAGVEHNRSAEEGIVGATSNSCRKGKLTRSSFYLSSDDDTSVSHDGITIAF